jgi:signal peptide peptidase SppA
MNVLDILNAPWALMPERYLELQAIYLRHLRGETPDLAAIEAKLGKPLNNEREPYQLDQGVAEINVHGVIGKRMNLFSEISGGVSTQLLAKDLRAALADPEAHSILLNVDSPGGEVDGTHEVAQIIRDSRGGKPIVALADGTMASAAYWIGSAADAVYAIGKTTQVGSIGVIATHRDVSKMYEMRGVKMTHITAGKYKAAGSPYQPLDAESTAILQAEVDEIYSTFVDEVASNRGRTPQDVLDNMADGRIFIGQSAIQAGLVDGIRSREEIIADLNRRAAHQALRSDVKSMIAEIQTTR